MKSGAFVPATVVPPPPVDAVWAASGPVLPPQAAIEVTTSPEPTRERSVFILRGRPDLHRLRGSRSTSTGSRHNRAREKARGNPRRTIFTGPAGIPARGVASELTPGCSRLSLSASGWSGPTRVAGGSAGWAGSSRLRTISPVADTIDAPVELIVGTVRPAVWTVSGRPMKSPLYTTAALAGRVEHHRAWVVARPARSPRA